MKLHVNLISSLEYSSDLGYWFLLRPKACLLMHLTVLPKITVFTFRETAFSALALLCSVTIFILFIPDEKLRVLKDVEMNHWESPQGNQREKALQNLLLGRLIFIYFPKEIKLRLVIEMVSTILQGQPNISISVKYNPLEESGTGFPIEPPRVKNGNGFTHSTSVIHPNAAGYSRNVKEDSCVSQHGGEFLRQGSHTSRVVGDFSSVHPKRADGSSYGDSTVCIFTYLPIIFICWGTQIYLRHVSYFRFICQRKVDSFAPDH